MAIGLLLSLFVYGGIPGKALAKQAGPGSTGNNVTFTVTGEFYYGIPFEGSDTIQVIGK